MNEPVVSEVLAEIGRRMPAPRACRELQVGLTNRSYLVELGGRALVLRLDTRHAATLGLDRACEVEIQRRAAAAGLAPAIVAASPDNGWLLYEYLEGRSLAPRNLAERATLEAIADLLRAVHALPRSGRVLSVSEAASRYAAIVGEATGLRRFAQRCVGIVTSAPPADDIRCCHNDVTAANVIANGRLANGRLRLIDWEYACDNEPLFDLAALAGYHDLDERATGVLLQAYSGNADEQTRERLAVQRRLFDALQWLWLAAEHVLAPRDTQRARLTTLEKRIG